MPRKTPWSSIPRLDQRLINAPDQRTAADASAPRRNRSGAEACIELPSADADDGQDCVLCDYFSCTNANPLETSYARDGDVAHGGDMFLPDGDPSSGVLGGINVTAVEARCAPAWSE